MNFPLNLQFGDFLGYHQYPDEILMDELIDELIETKEGGPICHCEIYLGNGKSFASRNGIGVNTYDFRSEGLVCVLRPKGLVITRDMKMVEVLKNIESKAQEFVAKVSGEGYDWKGLLNFYLTSDLIIPKHLFCSAAAIEFYRAINESCGANYSCPSNKYSPWDFYKMGTFDIVYRGFTL